MSNSLLGLPAPSSTAIIPRPGDCQLPSAARAMHITQLNRECLLHLFSFLDKNSRKNLAKTCHRLLEVFQDPLLWSLLNFNSPVELQKHNFLLGPALKYLSICWYSERVKVCNVEDWMKNSFQKDFCSRHENTVTDFLLAVASRMRPCNRRLPLASPQELPKPQDTQTGKLRADHGPDAGSSDPLWGITANPPRGFLPEHNAEWAGES
ncbi:F-box and leucine-rich protein 22 isoform X2 [Excalfactoria chinensis]|uniref:F-box and leucine-rich protein 22 isoform X2 n=1 Tax=Excalfactoria chinensis TaxID=46218 RepID=UPI003B3A2DB0